MRSSALSLDWEKICIELRLAYKKRSTGVIVILCPFHREKTPSCHLYPKSLRAKCYGCGTEMTAAKFVEIHAGAPAHDQLYSLVGDPDQMFLPLQAAS